MSLNNRNSGHDGPPPEKNSRSVFNNLASRPALSLRGTNLLPASQPPSAYYSGIMGNYGGDSSRSSRGSIPTCGMANGNYSTASFDVSHPFVGMQIAPSADAPSGFASTGSGATTSFYKGQHTVSTTNHKMPSVNKECSYDRGDGCLVQSMSHLVQFETCG